jgi:hypothetical protein
MCVVTPIKSMKHKYELLLNSRKMSESVRRNCKVNNVLPDRYVSTFILVESISVSHELETILWNYLIIFELFLE